VDQQRKTKMNKIVLAALMTMMTACAAPSGTAPRAGAAAGQGAAEAESLGYHGPVYRDQGKAVNAP
jgi:hypothetical protein